MLGEGERALPEVLRKECLEYTEEKENKSENQSDPQSCMAVGPGSYCARGILGRESTYLIKGLINPPIFHVA